MAPISVLIVDDQRLMRDGLRVILELEADFAVVGEAENGKIALEQYAALKPDVVLMDIRMPVMDGVEAIRQLIAKWPDVRVIILTTFDDDESVFEGIRAGALGYLLKDVSSDELGEAVRKVAGGDALIDPSVTRKVMAEFRRMPDSLAGLDEKKASSLADTLTEREMEVLRLLAEGRTNREIGSQLFLAEGTIKNYVSNILGKIEVRDRTQAALRGRELGLL